MGSGGGCPKVTGRMKAGWGDIWDAGATDVIGAAGRPKLIGRSFDRDELEVWGGEGSGGGCPKSMGCSVEEGLVVEAKELPGVVGGRPKTMGFKSTRLLQ
jgi:hypothetical protein